MAAVHGKDAHLQIDNAAGSLANVSDYADDISMPQELSADETTTFANTGEKTYISGLADAKVSCSGKFDPTIDTHMGALYAAFIAGTVTTASFEYGPAGNANGKPKRSGELIMTSYEVSSKTSDVVEWKAEFQVTGAVTRGTYSG